MIWILSTLKGAFQSSDFNGEDSNFKKLRALGTQFTCATTLFKVQNIYYNAICMSSNNNNNLSFSLAFSPIKSDERHYFLIRPPTGYPASLFYFWIWMGEIETENQINSNLCFHQNEKLKDLIFSGISSSIIFLVYCVMLLKFFLLSWVQASIFDLVFTM